MEEVQYKDNEKVLFNETVKVNPRSKNVESANCYVTEGSVIIESTEPLKIPLDRVKDCSFTTEAEYTDMGTSAIKLGPQTVKLRYRDTSGYRRVAELELDPGLGTSLADTVRSARARILHGQRPVEFAYAGFWRRFFAALIDGIILSIIGSILSGFENIEGVASWWWIIVTVVDILYYVLPYSTGGQTAGKALVGIKVAAIDGSSLNWRKGFLRYLGYIPSTVVLLLGFFWIIRDNNKQAWHDKLAGTCVVRTWVERDQLHDIADPSEARQKQRRWLLGLGIPSLLALIGAGIWLFPLIQQSMAGAKAVEPIVTAWRNEGLVESAEFMTTRVSSTGLPDYTVLEIRAMVPYGTLDDNSKKEEIADRLSSDITFSEQIDLLVVVLIEETGYGCASTRQASWRGYSVVGKEHLMDQAWEAWSRLPKNF